MPESLLKSLATAATLFQSGKYREAAELLQPLLQKVEALGKNDLLFDTLLKLGICHFEVGSLESARAALEQGLDDARKVGDSENSALFLHELSLVAFQEGDVATSKKLCTEAIALKLERPYRTVRKGFIQYLEYDLSKVSGELLQLAVVLQVEGDSGKAREVLELLRLTCQRSYDMRLLGKVLHELSLLAIHSQDFFQAAHLLTESMEYKAKAGDKQAIPRSMAILHGLLSAKPELLDPLQELLHMPAEDRGE